MKYLSMKIGPSIILFMISAIVAGCASAPVGDIKFEYQSDQSIDFSRYKSFSWLHSEKMINDDKGQWASPDFDLVKEVRSMITGQLIKRGMSERDNAPDIYVAFSVGVNMDVMELTVDPSNNLNVLKNIPKGALVMALVDRVTGFVVWTGTATADVSKKTDPNLIKGRLNHAITTLVKKIPKQ